MQPSLEDVVLGLIPGLPKVHLHNKVLAYSLGGDDFMLGADGRLMPVRKGQAPPDLRHFDQTRR